MKKVITTIGCAFMLVITPLMLLCGLIGALAWLFKACVRIGYEDAHIFADRIGEFFWKGRK